VGGSQLTIGWLGLRDHGMLVAMAEAAAIVTNMNPAEYFAWERDQASKHEYYLGEVFAMAGGSVRHNFLAGAIVAELRAALRGKGCYALTSDQRIAAEPGRRYVYADAVVVCGTMSTEPGTTDVLSNPCIIVEVLSRSATSYDRGDKWQAYQSIASLTDYLLIAQTGARIEHYLREGDGSWRYRVFQAGNTVSLANGATVSVDAVYQNAFDLAAD
jgi:Uma2 family endonuclease